MLIKAAKDAGYKGKFYTFYGNALGAPDLKWIRYIRIQSTGDNALRDTAGQLIEHRRDLSATSGNGSSGFDLDAVSAVNY